MSKFRSYLKDSGQTIKSFAARIGVSPSYLSEIAGHKKHPSLRVAVDIERESGGAIPATYWIHASPAAGGADTSHIATSESSSTLEKPECTTET